MLHDFYNVVRLGFSTNYYYLVISIWRINYSHLFMIIITIFATQEYFSILNIFSNWACPFVYFFGIWFEFRIDLLYLEPLFIEYWSLPMVYYSTCGMKMSWKKWWKTTKQCRKWSELKYGMLWVVARVLNLHFNLSAYTESVLRSIIIGWFVSLKCKKENSAIVKSLNVCEHYTRDRQWTTATRLPAILNRHWWREYRFWSRN